MSALAGTAIAGASVANTSLAGLPEPIIQTSADTISPNKSKETSVYNPVVTLNGWTLPYRMNGSFKEFHLVAEPVIRELAPGMNANLWGYNGQSPGPTIEVVEGDKVRIFLTNKLPEHTSIHWHGQRLPNGMDGVAGLNQLAVSPGKTFVYEFEAKRPGTFMYHPHADEMTQMAPLYPMTGYAIEGNVSMRVPEWESQRVQMKLEQSAFYDGEKVYYLADRQRKLHVVNH